MVSGEIWLQGFIAKFTGEKFDPDEWAELSRRQVLDFRSRRRAS